MKIRARATDATHSERTLDIFGLCCRQFWMTMRLSCKFRFHIGILNQHWLVEQGRRSMTDWPATVVLKWAIAKNHAATVEEDVIREAPVVSTGGQAGRWQAITDTTSIESSLVDLKEKGATPQDRRFLCVDCIKRTPAALGCRGRNNRTTPPPAEPPRNVLRGTSRTGGECRFEGGDSGWKPGCRAAAGQ